MPKKPQVRATNHAHAALAQLGERVWPGMWKIQTSVERNTYEFNLFLVGSAVWLSILSCERQDKKRHWELKDELAPFTPLIDLVLQSLWERCAHLLPCGKTNTDASRNKKRWSQSRAETAGQKLQHISSGTFLDSMPKELKVTNGTCLGSGAWHAE
ncbi:hypothetical protein NQZ68_040765 [Dissostichus eleginoides]|nr:hypothetical protein NQZ68_040765 [Dissostichus eleginoides]